MPTLLYLDFDGVLNSTGATDPLRFKPDRCEALNQIVQEFRIRIVVSSTWRHQYDEPGLDLLLRSHGIESFGQTQKTDITPNPNRAREILRHVQENKPQIWVALDDMPLEKELPPGHFSRSHPFHGPDWQNLRQTFQSQVKN